MSSSDLIEYNPSNILKQLFEDTEDAKTCPICSQPLEGKTFVICTTPVPKPSMTSREEEAWAKLPAVHRAHTACASCVDDMAHVGNKGKCVVCLEALGKARSVVHHAGVALQSPVENVTGTTFIKSSNDARKHLDEFQKQQELRDASEGAKRRAEALAGIEARNQAIESATRSTAEVTDMLEGVPEEEAAAVMERAKRAEELEREIAKNEYEEKLHEMRRVHNADMEREKKEAQDAAAALKETMQLEAQRMRDLAREEARLVRAKALQEATRVQAEAAAMAAEAEKKLDEAEEKRKAKEGKKKKPCSEPEVFELTDDEEAEDAPKKRKRAELDDEEKLRRREKYKETARLRKEKLQRVDQLEKELQNMQDAYTTLSMRKDELESIAKAHVELGQECMRRTILSVQLMLTEDAATRADESNLLDLFTSRLAETQQEVFAENKTIPFAAEEWVSPDGETRRNKISFEEHAASVRLAPAADLKDA